MAHFARIGQNGIVEEVIVVSNDVINNFDFPESEPLGVAFCKELYGESSNWAQTSYNSNFRYNYAGIGYEFNASAQPNGAFIPLKPYPSWGLNTNIYQWEPPIPYPADGKIYYWDENTQSWVEFSSQ